MIGMALDYLAFERIILLIKDRLVGGKVVKISQISNEEFLFVIRKEKKTSNKYPRKAGLPSKEPL